MEKEEIDFDKFVGNKIAEIKAAGRVVDVGIFSDSDVDYDDDADDEASDNDAHAEAE